MPGTNKPCPVTGTVGCLNRQCELHYMDAPLRLAPRTCPVCLGDADHAPFDPDFGCTDALRWVTQ